MVETTCDGDGRVLTTFRLPHVVPADRVCVVGEFNDWSPMANPMERDGGELVARVALLPGRAYRFRYLLDGERWENDWTADAYVPNELGGDDSVIDLSEHRSPPPLAVGARSLHAQPKPTSAHARPVKKETS